MCAEWTDRCWRHYEVEIASCDEHALDRRGAGQYALAKATKSMPGAQELAASNRVKATEIALDKVFNSALKLSVKKLLPEKRSKVKQN
jgi:hypothetical protein